MLIDDDPATNFLSNMIIDEADCALHIRTQTTAKDALNYITSADLNSKNETLPYPDLIFLDINMPWMNGWEFLEEYYKLDKQFQSEAIVVMLTTSNNPDDKIKAKLFNGVSDFKTKPLTKEMLEEIIDKYFKQQQ